MLKVIEVVFDGKAFVPTEPVDLPAGTKANVALPELDNTRRVLAGPPPPPLTPEQREEWERLLSQARDAESPWATVDEAIAYSRGRPWPEPPGESR
jgi:predicted DNA-binding antitoxin AbrB/MazE fold protein